MSAPHEWLFVKAYLQPPGPPTLPFPQLLARCDQLLTPLIQEAVATYRARGWIEQFFFIRYNEGGYHARLRFKGDPARLDGELWEELQARLLPFYQSQPEALGLPAGATLTAAMLRDELRCLQRAEYEPEFLKYGGPQAMPLAEQHFERCSEIVMQVLAAERATNVSRAHFALELMDALLAAFSPDPRERIFILKAYTSYWLNEMSQAALWEAGDQLEQNYQRRRASLARRLDPSGTHALERAWQGREANFFATWRAHLAENLAAYRALAAQGALLDPLAEQWAAQAALFETLPTIGAAPTVGLLLVPNYLHMLNNRLGLAPLQEIQLTHLLYRYLEEQAGIEGAEYAMVLEPAPPPPPTEQGIPAR